MFFLPINGTISVSDTPTRFFDKNIRDNDNAKSKLREVQFGIDMISIITFMTILNDLNDSNKRKNYIKDGKFDKENAKDHLKTASFNPNYIFNTYLEKETEGETNKEITEPLQYQIDDTLKICLGNSVDKFDSNIAYYVTGADDGGIEFIKFVNCKVYQTAEFNHILDIFAGKADDQLKDFVNYYTFTYQVPKINFDDGKPGFIGSSGLLLSDDFQYHYYEGNTDTISTFDTTSIIKGHCTYNEGFAPHAHAVAYGALNLNYKYNSPKGFDPDIKGEVVGSDLQSNKNSKVAADYCYSFKIPEYKKKAWSSQNVGLEDLNYVLQEQNSEDGVKFKNTYSNVINGVCGKELQYVEGHSETYWIGRTSGPLYSSSISSDNNDISKKGTEGYGKQNYFKPESIKALPLIKL